MTGVKVSVIIPNYNYEAYLPQTIDSALAIDWPEVEVIVVDDGSTDGSRRVMEGYGDRIVAIYQENASQTVACHTGFQRATGDLILFLDSDDLVEPSVIREAMAVWHPGVSKVQFQMKTIDADGRPLGGYLPQYRIVPTPSQIREWILNTSAYPTPPGSANIYSRRCVEQIYSLYAEMDDRAADSALLAGAPYLGEVIVIAKPLVSYRIHGRNDGAQLSLNEKKFSVEVARALKRHAFAAKVGRLVDIVVRPEVVYKSLALNTYRLASYRLAPELHPIPGDNGLKILRDTLRAAVSPQGVAPRGILITVAWGTAVALLPARFARSLVLWRFSSSARPEGLKRILRGLRIIR